MSAKKALSLLVILGTLALVGLTPGAARAATPLYGAFLISDQASDITHSAIAYNTQNHNYLVVWCHQQAGSTGVFARTISETGQLGPVYPVSDTTGDADRCDPDVAYDSRHNNYLVVWQHKAGTSFSVHGRLFSPGSYLGSDITFSDLAGSAATPPAVDYAYTSDEFLVVWAYWASGVNSSIISQRLTYDGLKVGTNITIMQGHDTISAYDPDLAYNLARNEYLVAYTRLDTNAPGGPNKDIFGWRLTHDQLKLGSELQISYLTPDELHPSVAALPTASPESGRYLVAYQTDFYDTSHNFIDNDVWGQIVLGDGTLVFPGAYFVIEGTEAHEAMPAVASSQSSNDFLVTWTATYAPDYVFSSIGARTVYPNATTQAADWVGGFFANNSSVAAGRYGDYLSAADDITLFGNRDLYGRFLGNRIFMPQIIKPAQ
jgi:hypothetical protein